MKKIIIFICVFLISCNRPFEVKENEGEIIEIVKKNQDIYVQIEFDHSIGGYSYSYWFIGSDTCKVGQKIQLK